MVYATSHSVKVLVIEADAIALRKVARTSSVSSLTTAQEKSLYRSTLDRSRRARAWTHY
jgi:RNA polymerase-interacting CarD/CdnL/TRCF family regulator